VVKNTPKLKVLSDNFYKGKSTAGDAGVHAHDTGGLEVVCTMDQSIVQTPTMVSPELNPPGVSMSKTVDTEASESGKRKKQASRLRKQINGPRLSSSLCDKVDSLKTRAKKNVKAGTRENAGRPQTRAWTNRVTVPKSPNFRLNSRSQINRSRVKSTEELELEEIEKKKKEAAMLRRKSQRSIKAVRQGNTLSANGTRSQPIKRKGVTVPKEPNLRTSKRQKPNRVDAKPHFKASDVAFTQGTVNKAADTHLRASRSRQAKTDAMKKMQKSTWKPKLTLPKTPSFATTSRSRPPRFKPTEEIEAEEAARAREMIKAKPVKKHVMQPRQPKKPVKQSRKMPTVPQPFSFETDKRASRKPAPMTKPQFVFGNSGPITRSRAKHSSTARPQLIYNPMFFDESISKVPSDASLREQEPVLDKTVPAENPRLSALMPQTGNTSKKGGSLLRTGALRVLRVPQNDEDDNQKENVVQANVHVVGAKSLLDASHDANIDAVDKNRLEVLKLNNVVSLEEEMEIENANRVFNPLFKM